MQFNRQRILVSTSLVFVTVCGLSAMVFAGQATLGHPAVMQPSTVQMTFEEAKQRALGNSKLLNLAHLNAQSKDFAVRAMQASYFPAISGSAMYFHFNDDLGTVLSTQGRQVTGPHGTPLVTFPATAVNLPVVNQDASFATVYAAQPITDLLKVRQGVNIARADQAIAQAQAEKGAIELASGVEQLCWALVASRRIQAGAMAAVKSAEALAKTGNLDARTALLEGQQALGQVSAQIADLQEQLNGLLDLPLSTTVELVPPPLPSLLYHSADEVAGMALMASPEIREAQQTLCKAQAALCAGKLDFVPSIAVIGGYANQTAASYIQQDIGYLGVMGSYTFVDWGKRRNVIHERENLVMMATLKLHQTEDDVRQKATKAFREVGDNLEAVKAAEQMVVLRKEAVKVADTPQALQNPTALITASNNLMTAEVNAIKADLAYRIAYVKMMAMVGQH
jgi:outer membrane protein TolC